MLQEKQDKQKIVVLGFQKKQKQKNKKYTHTHTQKTQLKQSWLLAFWKKDLKKKRQKRWNRTLFDQTKQDRMQIFESEFAEFGFCLVLSA